MMDPNANAAAPIEIVVPWRRFIRTLVGICVSAEILFVLLDYHVNFGRGTEIGALRRLFNIAHEDSLASWFGTTQTLLIGLTLWVIYLALRRGPLTRRQRAGWLLLAVFFTYMAADDGAQIHERMGSALTEWLDHDSSGGLDPAGAGTLLDAFPSYTWLLFIMPVFAGVGTLTMLFVWNEVRLPYARYLVLAAVGCFALAIGLDFIEGLDEEHSWNLYMRVIERVDLAEFTAYRFRQDPYDTLRHFSKSIEEFLEMLGSTLLWVVFLKHLREVAVRLELRWGGKEAG